MGYIPEVALRLEREQALGFFLASLLLLPACAPEEPPDIPDDVVADYVAAVDDCVAKSEGAQPIMREARELLETYFDQITTAIRAQPDGEGPFIYRFDDERTLTAYAKYEYYQIYVTLPAGVAFEGIFGRYVDPYFPNLDITPLKRGVLGAYMGASHTFVGTSDDPTSYEPITVGGGDLCETEGSSVGYTYSDEDHEAVFFGAMGARPLPTIHVDLNYTTATLCRQGSCSNVEGKNVKRFSTLSAQISIGTGPQLDYGLQPVIRGKNR